MEFSKNGDKGLRGIINSDAGTSCIYLLEANSIMPPYNAAENQFYKEAV